MVMFYPLCLLIMSLQAASLAGDSQQTDGAVKPEMCQHEIKQHKLRQLEIEIEHLKMRSQYNQLHSLHGHI